MPFTSANPIASRVTVCVVDERSEPELEIAVRELAGDPADRNAWQRFFVLVWPYLMSLASRHLAMPHGNADTEDLAQETLLKFSNALHANRIVLSDATRVRALLAVMTRRLALDRIRFRRRKSRDERKNVSLDQSADPYSINEGIAAVEWSDLVNVVQSRLDVEESRVLHLRLQGYQLSEIATQGNVSQKTVQRRLLSVRRKLQSAMQDPK